MRSGTQEWDVMCSVAEMVLNFNLTLPTDTIAM